MSRRRSAHRAGAYWDLTNGPCRRHALTADIDRAALDSGADLATITPWITGTEAEQARYQAIKRVAADDCCTHAALSGVALTQFEQIRTDASSATCALAPSHPSTLCYDVSWGDPEGEAVARMSGRRDRGRPNRQGAAESAQRSHGV